jgi:hypothetical protein
MDRTLDEIDGIRKRRTQSGRRGPLTEEGTLDGDIPLGILVLLLLQKSGHRSRGWPCKSRPSTLSR